MRYQLAQEVLYLFDQWWGDTQFQTYITSISEHDDSEDQHGRLSMWRAFSRSSARVALVLRIPIAPDTAESLSLVLSPVAYFTDTRLGDELRSVIRNIEASRTFLQTVNRAHVVGSAFNMLVNAALCLKHEGFHEEREWRIIHSPNRHPSSLVRPSIEVIGGVPQTLYKIPLSGAPPPDLAISTFPTSSIE